MTDYSKDAISVDDNTTADELISYTLSRVKNPIQIKDVTIYDFNTHKPDREALHYAVEHKLRNNVFKIPIQVTGINPFIISLLPEKIREADNLIYRQNIERYYAYKSFNAEIDNHRKINTREKISNIIDEH